MSPTRKTSDRTVELSNDARLTAPDQKQTLSEPTVLDEELLKQISGGGGEPDGLPKGGW
jgi:hypothetical protein